MSRSRNFSLTSNNPVIPVTEFHDLISKNALYARVQSEKGEQGTLHFQSDLEVEGRSVVDVELSSI